MLSPERMSLHSPILHSASKTYKDWRSLANSTSVGGTTTSGSIKATNGKAHSQHEEDYLNQKSYSLECPTCQPVFNALSITKSWKQSTGNLVPRDSNVSKIIWTTSGLEQCLQTLISTLKSSTSYLIYLRNTAYT